MGFRFATEADALQAGERIIKIPDHGYVIVAWRSSTEQAGLPITVLRRDGSPIIAIGPSDLVNSLSWKNTLATLDNEPP
ncbi:MAG TPA: hypothetical protein VGS19_28185 [Streptosporangiaceae bacterium]|nr:hypothetical protein [Streptosporangiaceae bacterium]